MPPDLNQESTTLLWKKEKSVWSQTFFYDAYFSPHIKKASEQGESKRLLSSPASSQTKEPQSAHPWPKWTEHYKRAGGADLSGVVFVGVCDIDKK